MALRCSRSPAGRGEGKAPQQAGIIFSPPQSWALQQVDDSEQHHPDTVHEVPEQLGRLEAEVMLAGDGTAFPGLPPHDQDQDHPQGDVKAVEACEHIEGASEQVGGETERQGEVLPHLAHQEGRPQGRRDHQPGAAPCPLPLPQLPGRAVEREAAGHQQRRVDGGQQQFEFVDPPGGQGVDGPEGEVGGEQAGKGHAIGHQKQGQAEQAHIHMGLFNGGRGALFVGGGKKGGHGAPTSP